MTSRIVSHTGGLKQFVYSEEDLKRIENSDTKYTREFKDDLRRRRAERHYHHNERPHMSEYYETRRDQPYYQHTREPERNYPRKSKKYFFLDIAVLLLIIFGILTYMTLAQKTEYKTEDRPATRTVEYNETISSVISFKPYLETVYAVEGQRAEFKAFLKRYVKGTQDTGIIAYAVVDDFNNTIEITQVAGALKDYFPKTGRSEKTFKVKGSFQRDYKTLRLSLSSLEESTRDPEGVLTKEKVENYTETVTREIITPKFPKVRKIVLAFAQHGGDCEDGTSFNACSENKPYFCSFGELKQNAGKCGCPDGERLYKDACIQIVKCSDGTLEPECSKQKPKQCVGAKLINNAEVCGCPDDYKMIGMACEKIKRCSDGTIYGECSKKKPYFCSGGSLVEDAALCGCEWGDKQVGGKCMDSSKAEAIEALAYVNKLRKSNGRSELGWDENLYALALFRAKDMYDRKYFDHVTPDGKCVKDYKGNFGLSKYDIAENAGASTYNYDFKNVDYASYKDPIQQVDEWMESRGHRFNLLYPAHIAGAVACYRGACIFLGANMDGFGSGPCTTGAQGMAFWAGAGRQPGEV